MSIISFNSRKENKEEVKKIGEKHNAFKEAMFIISDLGVNKVHERLGQKYEKAHRSYKEIRKNRRTIALVLGLNENEYKDYIERMFELGYVLEMFDATYSQTNSQDPFGNAICLTILPRIVELLDWFDNIYETIEERWEGDGSDELNLEVAELFIKACDRMALTAEELDIDYDNLLSASRSADRYVIIDLKDNIMRFKTFKDKSEAFLYIMKNKHLDKRNLIEKY